MRIKGLSKGSRAVKLFWLFTALALFSGCAALITHLLAHELFGWSSTVHRERREIELSEQISISSADIPLSVYTHNGDKIIVEYKGETALIIEETDLELRIGREEDFALSLFSMDKLNYEMKVWLPEYSYKEIKLTTASGDIYAEKIRAELTAVTSRSGDVSLYGVEGLIAVNTRYGDVNAEFINFTDSCAIDVETGAVSVIMPTRFDVKLDFLTASGLFTSDFFRKEYYLHAGDLYLSTGVNSIRFTVRTVSGNLDFHKRDETVG
ncbi:MAG: DUF4097 domain-containing protein [Oscillospiraceae bacterium]|nr:DUF4097 domain-containing protein [Oscillospiraceae bacterium]